MNTKYIVYLSLVTLFLCNVEGTTFCDEPVEVIYDFTPDDPSMIDSRYLVIWPLEGIRYTINGQNPPRRGLEVFGLEEGSDHRCTRFRVYKGTCEPVVYEFEGIDDVSVYDSCDVWEQGNP